jgi:murein tripeptide amidase MpaA
MRLSNLLAGLVNTMLLSSVAAMAGPAAEQAVLPPELPWSGASRALLVPKGDPWITPAEAADLERTPRYDETVAWLQKLVKAAPQLRMVSLGKSPEGRDIWMVIASADKAFTPEALKKSGKPLLFAQAGIHSGEIDGKDAGLMLLRDLTVRGTKKDLLAGANLLFVPIFSVDAHERFSKFGRVNQRGPAEMGWRTNARNLNLNRDYAKADTPEMRAMLRALDTWDPDLYIDIHVTDGADYQYDITWDYASRQPYSPEISAWLDGVLSPAWTRDLKAMGHIPGRYVELKDDLDVTQGISSGPDSPRYSTGYGNVRHLPTILIETHSLKPYAQRVLGTYVMLESTLRLLGSSGKALRQAIDADRARRQDPVVLTWKVSEKKPAMTEFLGVESRLVPSAVSGALKIEWLGKPVTVQIPGPPAVEPGESVKRPKAYWIPPQWPEVVDRLALHGIRFERIAQPRDLEVEMLRIEDPNLAAAPFEGHMAVGGKPVPEKRREHFVAGSVRVPTDQPLGDLAIVLLEPLSTDSFYAWGFFLEILQQTEYVEGYIMEPMAERMLAEDPKLAQEFVQKLHEDEKFRSSPSERLEWFYRKTPFYDDRWRLYPVAREY